MTALIASIRSSVPVARLAAGSFTNCFGWVAVACSFGFVAWSLF